MPWRTAVVAILCVAGLAPRLAAHHSHANYDVTTWTVMEGTVKQLVLMAPHSIVYLEVKDLHASYEEAWSRLREIYGPGQMPRTVNMISGPSRTADIEQTIVRPAHGPKDMHVIIVKGV